MSLKNFENLFKPEEFDESHFILGIDIGDATSAICYFDVNKKTTEIIDISGGYGKTTIPTAMQYSKDNEEWIFGEYALLNQGIDGEIMLSNFVRNLGNDEYIDIGEKTISITEILSLYITELISSCKNINPKAEVVGIVVSIPDYFTENAKKDMALAFKQAGLEKKVIDFLPYRECIFSYEYFNKEVEKENVLMLDFGSRDITGGIYNVESDADEIVANAISYMIDENISSEKVESSLLELFIGYYLENKNISKDEISEQDMGYINSFVYQHKDLIFQKNTLTKPLKLYFNFAFPAFQHSITNEDVASIIDPFKTSLKEFLEKLINNSENVDGKPITFENIDTILCTGGGFEMSWPRMIIEEFFSNSDIKFYKNAKIVAAEGAAILAASKLSVIEEKTFKIYDISHVVGEIGIYITRNKKKKEFFPVVKEGGFWWQEKSTFMVIVNHDINNSFNIELAKRDLEGNIVSLTFLTIKGLPSRPAGTTKLKISFEYTSDKELRIDIIDQGFGELFKASGYQEKYFITL